MSTSCTSVDNIENPTVDQHKVANENINKKSVRKMSNTSGGRKTLQTLQPSGKNQALLVGADGLLRMSGSKTKKGSGQCAIYEDPIPTMTSTPERKPISKAIQAVTDASNAGTQVEDADTAQVRAELFMYTDEYPPDYWKELAEKRREALDSSLAENEELHASLSQLEEEKTSLIQERDSLREMAEQAEQLAKIVKTLVGDDDGDDADTDDCQEDEASENDGDKSENEEENTSEKQDEEN